MKDELEEWIKTNREALRTSLPEGHVQRFEARLNQTKEVPKQPEKKSWTWLLVAASVLALVGMFTWISPEKEGEVQQVAKVPTDSSWTLRDVSSDLAEVEDFYLESIAVQLGQIEEGAKDEAVYLHHAQQWRVLEEQYDQLKKDLALSQGDPRVVAAMIQNYRLRMEVLQKLMEYLKIHHEQKNDTDENAHA